MLAFFQNWLIAVTILNQPIQVGFTPAAAGDAVEGKGVVLIM